MRTVWLSGMTVLCLLVTVEATAAVPPAVLGLDMRDPRCTVQAASLEEGKLQSAGEVRGLTHQLAIMAKFQKFMDSRKWKPNMPIGDQMTPSQANEFGNLQEQTKIGVMAMILEAHRGRDIRVFARMAEMAKRMRAEYLPPADEKNEEFSLAAFLMVGREKFQLSDDAEVDAMAMSQGKCTLQNALIAEAKRILDSIDTIPGVHNASADMTGLGQKYGSPIDRTKLDDTEKILYDRTTAAMDTAIQRQTYFKDLLFIARLEDVSKIQQDARRKSQYEALGDNNHINVVWNEWVKEGKITKEQNELSRILNYINEKFPTDLMKSLPDKKVVK